MDEQHDDQSPDLEQPTQPEPAAASLPPWCQPGVDGRPTIPPFCRYEDGDSLVVRYQTYTGDRLLATDFQRQPDGTWTRWEFSPPIPEGWSVVQSVSVDANGLKYPPAVLDTDGNLWLRYAVYRSFTDAVLPFERMRKRYAAVISMYLPNS